MPQKLPDRPDFLARHRALLEQAVAATAGRDHWTPYPESPSRSVYGEGAAKSGEAAFREALGGHFRGGHFALPGHPGHGALPATEESPYGFPLGVTYLRVAPEEALAAATAATGPWRDAEADTRAGVAAEILGRLNAASSEIAHAHAVEHTTGQAFVMAFQAGGPHTQDRGLGAVAYAWAEQERRPDAARWSKPRGKGGPLVIDKKFTPVGRGVALLIACDTFPTWNGYPGLSASWSPAIRVVVKPHPGAVLPLAITVRIAREVLAEAGFDARTW